MQTMMQTETPGTDDRPEELPENERPEEMPMTEEGPVSEPESPEIGRPAPGPGPDQPGEGITADVRLHRAEDAMVSLHPRRTVGGWRDTLRRR